LIHAAEIGPVIHQRKNETDARLFGIGNEVIETFDPVFTGV